MKRRSLLSALLAPLVLRAEDEEDDGTTRLTIHVTNHRDKPIERASVVVRFQEGRSIRKFGKTINTHWELRTNREGDAKIPPIPQGKILIQVIADNYQTFGDYFEIEEPERTVEIKLSPPGKQFSAHDEEK
jgi:hypothetical protein